MSCFGLFADCLKCQEFNGHLNDYQLVVQTVLYLVTCFIIVSGSSSLQDFTKLLAPSPLISYLVNPSQCQTLLFVRESKKSGGVLTFLLLT
jgi:hypothetical protein